MFQGELPYEPYFIAINNQGQVIIGPNKKMVATYVVGVKFTNGGLSFSLFHLPFSFLLFSFYFLIFLFLEYRVRVRSQDTENEVEGSRTNDVIQHGDHMLTSCSTHGHLG